MVLLGEFLLAANQHDEAERLLLEALRGCRKSLDHNHDTTEAVLEGLTALYIDRGDFKKAEPYCLEGLDTTRSRWGADHEMTAKAVYNAGMILFVQKHYARAEPYLRECLARCIRTNPDRLERFAAETWLGKCLRAQKKYTEAEARLLSACSGLKALRESVSPEPKGDLGRAMEELVRLYSTWGQTDKAEEWRRKRADLDFPINPFAPP